MGRLRRGWRQRWLLSMELGIRLETTGVKPDEPPALGVGLRWLLLFPYLAQNAPIKTAGRERLGRRGTRLERRAVPTPEVQDTEERALVAHDVVDRGHEEAPAG
jgi:hypothetical protein